MTTYFFYTHTINNVLSLLFLGLSIFAGGWLIAHYVFTLRTKERGLTGLALGLVLYIFFANLWGHILPIPGALWAGAGTVLLLGIGLSWPWRGLRRSLHELTAVWRSWLSMLGLAALFWMMLRGMYVFDDYFHLPLLSSIAAGNFPPQFHLNPAIRLDYHYGLHLFAAFLLRLGGLFPWSAWDFSRALVSALTLHLVWLWGKRITRSARGAWMLTALLAFGSGTRWLLLFLPGRLIKVMGSGLTLFGTAAATGPDLLTNLSRPWAVSGISPLNIPFAFINGFWYPITLTWGGSSSLPLLVLLLILLIYPRQKPGWKQSLIFCFVLAAYALISEYALLFFLFGMGLIWLRWAWTFWKRKETGNLSRLKTWAILAFGSLLIAFSQGGVLGGLAASLLNPSQKEQGFGFSGFALRWPPALVSGHLGPLSLANPAQALLAGVEIGPVVLLLPILFVFGWYWLTRQSQNAHLEAGLALGALVGFTLPLFLRYGIERDQARLFSFAIYVSLLLVAPFLWKKLPALAEIWRWLFWGGYAVTLLAGILLFGLQLLSLKTPLLSDFITPQDARIFAKAWNTLPENALVLDRNPPRGVTVLGRLTASSRTTYQTLPEWETLIADLDPYRAAAQGYDYIYMDGKWWNDLNAARARFDADCVQTLFTPDDLFDQQARWLIDIRNCH